MHRNLFIIALLVFSLWSCILDRPELDTELSCTPEAFVGEWAYQSTDGIVLDSIEDLTITLSDNLSAGEIQVNRRYYFVKPTGGCVAGRFSGLLDQTYELRSDDVLVRLTTVFLFFGSVDLYERK